MNIRATLKIAQLLSSVGVTIVDDQIKVIEALTSRPEVYGFTLDNSPDFDTHDGLVDFVLANDEAMTFLENGQKIQAIKVVRQATDAGLKRAKDAVEDARVASLVEANRQLALLRQRLGQSSDFPF